MKDCDFLAETFKSFLAGYKNPPPYTKADLEVAFLEGVSSMGSFVSTALKKEGGTLILSVGLVEIHKEHSAAFERLKAERKMKEPAHD